jgi:hypothetical protein
MCFAACRRREGDDRTCDGERSGPSDQPEGRPLDTVAKARARKAPLAGEMPGDQCRREGEAKDLGSGAAKARSDASEERRQRGVAPSPLRPR